MKPRVILHNAVSADGRVDWLPADIGLFYELAAALEELAARFGVRVVRVDSGGKLNGELLRLGLVDEISLLVHPHLVGGDGPASMFRAADLMHEVGVLQLELLQSRKVKQGIVWLRYAVKR